MRGCRIVGGASRGTLLHIRSEIFLPVFVTILIPYGRVVVDSSGEVPRGEKMLYSGTDPESHITEYTFLCEDKLNDSHRFIFVY